MDDYDGFYCDDCCDWHEYEEGCWNTRYDCQQCAGKDTVQIMPSSNAEASAEAVCEQCGYAEEVL